MSKIMQAWENLLRDAVAKDDDTRQYAAFQIALILERHYQPNQDAPTLYEEHLSRELQRLTLSPDRQRDAVQYLLQLAANNLAIADTYLYGVTLANPEVALPQLLDWIVKQGALLNDDAIYQIVDNLRRVKRLDDPSLWQTVVKTPIVMHFLQDWLSLDNEMIATRVLYLLD